MLSGQQSGTKKSIGCRPPSSVMVRPMTPRSPPRPCCHRSWRMITTACEVVASLNAEDPLGRARAGQVHAWRADVRDAGEDVVLIVVRHVGGRYATAVIRIVAL